MTRRTRFAGLLATALAAGLALGAGIMTASTAAVSPEGAYWHTRVIYASEHPWRFGTKADPYRLTERQIMEGWATRDGRFWTGSRELGARPSSAADEQAWQRDGSPGKWSTSIDGKTVKMSTEPANGHVLPNRTSTQFFLAGQRLTYEEVQRLPADAERLKDWLRQAGRVSRVPPAGMDSWVTSSLPATLYDLPAPKEVRAAAYEALLTMPGVRAAGQATDALGRTGASVVLTRPGKEGGTGRRLIVDTGRMMLLSSGDTVRPAAEEPASTHTTTVVEAGWTDAPPAVPALP
ncbi:hypothetical protein AB0K12_35370 [Nonomuraea sp. NPDC049419]|uniref:hypothetical protein n=1 Tax=Nonomuraea sp. NPDC049419 TaxID=3155772 RepID=UPI003428C6EA